MNPTTRRGILGAAGAAALAGIFKPWRPSPTDIVIAQSAEVPPDTVIERLPDPSDSFYGGFVWMDTVWVWCGYGIAERRTVCDVTGFGDAGLIGGLSQINLSLQAVSSGKISDSVLSLCRR
jgi:hypothetical protein